MSLGAGLRLIDAALHGRAVDIITLHQEYPQLVKLPQYYDKALFCAMTQGHVDSVIALGQCFPKANFNQLYPLCDNSYSQVDRSTALHQAAAKGYDACITASLEHFGRGSSVQDSEEMTPLMLAAIFGHPACVKALGKVADPDATGFSDETALMYAAEYGNDDCIIALYQSYRYIDPNLVDEEDHHSAIFYACHDERNVKCVLALCRCFPQLRHTITVEYRPERRVLEYAASHGNAAGITALFKCFPDIDICNSVSHADREGHIDVICELYRCFPDTWQIDGASTVTTRDWFIAAMTGDIPKLKSLFQASSHFNVNMRTQSGITALMFAAAMGHSDVIVELSKMSPNIDVNACTVSNYNLTRLYCDRRLSNTALSHAALYGRVECISALFDCFPNMNKNCAQTALLMAAVRGHPDCIQAIHKYCPNIDVNSIKDQNHHPLLHCVRDPQSVVMLQKCFPSIDCKVKTEYNPTVLFTAVQPPENSIQRGSPDWIRALRCFPGIDPNATNSHRQTALFTAVLLHNPPAILALGESFPSIDPNIIDTEFHSTCLMMAVAPFDEEAHDWVFAKDRHDCIPALCSAFSTKIKVNMQDRHGRTALIRATRNSDPLAAVQIRHLFEYFPSIDPSIRCKRGYTALMYAVSNSKSCTVLCTLLSLILKYC